MPILNAPDRPYHESFARFLGTARHSDFVIECCGHVFRVHKTLLCARSEYFDRLCDSPFQEGPSCRVQLDDEDPAIVARMLLFIYTDTYPISDVAAESAGHDQFKDIRDAHKKDASDKAEWANRARLHALMYAAADKYLVSGLQRHSAHRFLAAFCEYKDVEVRPENGVYDRCSDNDTTPSDGVEPPASEWESRSESPPARSPYHTTEDSWTKEADIVKLVYTSTPSHCRALRHAVVWVIERCTANDESRSPLECDSILTALRDVSELAFDIASTVMSKREYRCSNCNALRSSLVTRCKCRKLDRCIEPDCLQRMQDESICAGCHCFGTLVFSTDGVEGDANGPSA